MKTFRYQISDPVGIHARPAGLLVKEAKKYESGIVIKKGEKEADAKKLLALIGLGVVCTDEITVEISGPDEEAALLGIREFLEQTL